MERWEVRQFFIVMGICFLIIAFSVVYSFFYTVKNWIDIFKYLQLILIVSGSILVVKKLINASNIF